VTLSHLVNNNSQIAGGSGQSYCRGIWRRLTDPELAHSEGITSASRHHGC